ncbi:hypothetical protein COW46_02570 [Candidatus Gracilibacteria bacterium CG17_big_fil_post_rev_8_21_14_2_50_48_13]|nr:MAG: hypothetical protein COW46_02570 [Candidatus Gracilibacteria bacterium CG17_big_fil_post_rev_8_21_14_2_50_48_13]
MPRISVLMATYNRRSTLPHALASLRAQEFTDWECLLVDDGSTDGTLAYVEDVASVDARIQVFHQENSGQGAALDLAARQSVGEFLCFLDSDDQYMPDHLTRQHTAMLGNPTVDFAYSNPLLTGSPYVRDVETGGRISVDDCIVLGTIICRRQALPASFALLPAYGIDYFWKEDVQRRGLHVGRMPHATYLYNRTGDDELTKQ